jgi:SAM-dependent methyltransferase
MRATDLFDERGSAGPEHLDPTFVAGYDRKAGVDPIDDLGLLCRRGLDASSTLVDLGAGTGALTLRAAPHCRRVVAVDVSPVMLAHLAGAARRRNLTNVECVEAGFLTYEHSGPPPTFVYSRNALHHLPDFWKAIALDRIAGMLPARGVFRLRDLVYDFAPGDADAALGRWLAGAVDDPTAGYTRHDLAEHVRSEYSTYRWLLEPMLGAAGFEIEDAAFERGVYARYTCVKARGAATRR